MPPLSETENSQTSFHIFQILQKASSQHIVSMVKIHCPNNNCNEREYIVSYIFGNLLNLNTEIEFRDDAGDYHILLENGKCIIVEDHFFNLHPENLSYLSKDNIPVSSKVFHYGHLEIPMIYGEDRLIQEDGKITLGLDIFASSFFMLSRWEEYALGRQNAVLDLKRSYYQMDEEKLFCVKNKLTDRAVVHEYEDLLRSLMGQMGFDIPVERTFRIKLTHDVDVLGTPYTSDVLKDIFENICRGKLRKAFFIFKKDLKIKMFSPDRFKMFDRYLAISGKYGFSDVFLFKCCEKGEEECTYRISDRKTRRIVKKLREKSVSLGIHPSPSAFNNNIQFAEEYGRFVKATGAEPMFGRNHRLVFNINTLHQWESVSMPVISNMGYQLRMGFRCGIVHAFPVFDIYSRRQSSVLELPFLMMDTSYRRLSKDDSSMKESMLNILKTVEKHRGVLCINWHERMFTKEEFCRQCNVYDWLLKSADNLGAKNFL